MVQAMININEHENRVLNMVKAKYGLKDKSAAINQVISEYEENIMEPALRPEFIEKMKQKEKNKKIFVGTVENLRKRYE